MTAANPRAEAYTLLQRLICASADAHREQEFPRSIRINRLIIKAHDRYLRRMNRLFAEIIPR